MVAKKEKAFAEAMAELAQIDVEAFLVAKQKIDALKELEKKTREEQTRAQEYFEAVSKFKEFNRFCEEHGMAPYPTPTDYQEGSERYLKEEVASKKRYPFWTGLNEQYKAIYRSVSNYTRTEQLLFIRDEHSRTYPTDRCCKYCAHRIECEFRPYLMACRDYME